MYACVCEMAKNFGLGVPTYCYKRTESVVVAGYAICFAGMFIIIKK